MLVHIYIQLLGHRLDILDKCRLLRDFEQYNWHWIHRRLHLGMDQHIFVQYKSNEYRNVHLNGIQLNK